MVLLDGLCILLELMDAIELSCGGVGCAFFLGYVSYLDFLFR
jgi:hypothetical protein